MLGRVVDIAEYRSRKDADRGSSLRSFGLLPCPRCDRETPASQLFDGGARFVCDDGHAAVEWSYDGNGGVVIDGRPRRFLAR